MTPLVSLLVLLDTLQLQQVSLYEFLVSNIDELLSVRRFAVEFAKSSRQI